VKRFLGGGGGKFINEEGSGSEGGNLEGEDAFKTCPCSEVTRGSIGLSNIMGKKKENRRGKTEGGFRRSV